MSYKHVINTSLPYFNLPDQLEDIISLNEIEDEISVDAANVVLSNIRSINEVVQIDAENDMVQFLEGGHTCQVLRFSLSSLIQVLYMKPDYIKAVVEIFRIDEYFVNIQDSIDKQINEILEKSPLIA